MRIDEALSAQTPCPGDSAHILESQLLPQLYAVGVRDVDEVVKRCTVAQHWRYTNEGFSHHCPDSSTTKLRMSNETSIA